LYHSLLWREVKVLFGGNIQRLDHQLGAVLNQAIAAQAAAARGVAWHGEDAPARRRSVSY
jgi:hypothetical protein